MLFRNTKKFIKVGSDKLLKLFPNEMYVNVLYRDTYKELKKEETHAKHEDDKSHESNNTWVTNNREN
jgi:hypothetical protein